MYKKILSILICVFALFIIIGCNENNENKDVIEEVSESLLSDVDKLKVTENLVLPTKLEGVVITWESSNEEVVSTTGVVTRGETDFYVTLKATLKYEDKEKVLEIKVKVLAKEKEEGGETNPSGYGTVVSCKEANEIGSKLGADETSETVYVVSGVITEVVNDMFGNLYITDDNGANKFYLYGLFDLNNNRYDSMDPKPVVGDTVTAYGKITNYKGNTVEIKNATMVEFKKGEGNNNNPGGDVENPEQGEFKGEFATDLFISEYYEGSKGNNKYLEIYNGTGKEVDLSSYKIVLFANGASEPNEYGVFQLSGKLSHNKALVVYNSQASVAEILNCGGLSAATGVSFNGNDAVGLYKGDVLIDIFGIIGNDPGKDVGWTVGSGTTCNSTIIRNSNVGYPNAKWDVNEWTYLGSDVVSNIGVHNMNFDGKVPEGGNEDNPIVDTVTKVTCKEANEIGSKLESDAETEIVYELTGVILEIYNDQYGNMYISDDNGLNKFNVYGVVDGETKFTGLNPLPKVGDTITVKGKIKNYKGTTVEIFNAQLVELKVSEGGNEDNPGGNEEALAFSSFSESSFMTSGANLKDVPEGWEIKVDKGSYATKWQSFRKDKEYVKTKNFEAQSKVNVDFVWYLNNLADGTSKIKFEALDKDGNVICTVTSDNLSLEANGLGAENAHTLSVSLEGEGIVSVKISFEKSKGGNIAFSSVKLYN